VMAALLATAYLLISGGAIATVRAYIMVLVMLVAVLLDRPAIALRNVAIAALIILLARPESLLSAGFQMSFAAVVALVSAYEALRERADARRVATIGDRGRFARAVLWIAGIGLTTVIASAAVAPIAAYHFQRSQQYALLANIIAGPVMNLWVMPLGLISMLLMPFGLGDVPLWLMGFGIDLTRAVASWIAKLPGAMILVPAMPWPTFVMIVLGSLWLALWRRRWRLWGVVLIAGGLAGAAIRSPVDVLVGRDASVVAVRTDSGALSIMGRRGRWVVERWLLRDGDSRDAGDVIRAGRSACDSDSCSMRVRGMRVTLTRHPRAFADDCAAADILIVAFAKPAPCPEARLVIDKRSVIERGVHTVTFQSPMNWGWTLQWWPDPARGFVSSIRPGEGAQTRGHRSTAGPRQRGTSLVVSAVDDARGDRPWVATRALRERQWQLLRTRNLRPTAPATTTPAPDASSADISNSRP
ncbi:MAG: ComEC/Rec2 family competence protein, partial [Pseudomonadota bacterium]